MANIVNPRTVNVTLRGKAEKARWAALAPLDNMPSRFPLTDLITDMGIQVAWEGLVEAGHLTSLFANVYGSYRAWTLEFLSTLQVNYENKVLVSITFRLENVEHTLSLAQFNAIFQLLDEDEEGCIEEPAEYDRDEFWRLITLDVATSSRGPTFTPSRAKINSIRNPVLRYMAKALVCFPFAHKELGSISSEMLFILWGTLAHRRINVGYFMIKHLERHAKKNSGKLCCGGVVTALALHLDLSAKERIPDGGSCVIDGDTLKKAGMVTVDCRGAGYFVLDKDTFFRFPAS